MTRRFILALVFAFAAPSAFAGFITPAEMSMALNQIYFVDPSSNTVSAGLAASTLSFKASDTDFTSIALGTMNVPEGRFIGLGLDVGNTRSVKLDGNFRYVGSDGTQFTEGKYLCSTGTATDGTGVVGVATQGGCASAPTTLTFNLPNSPSASVVSFSYFANPICITTAADKASICKSGDTFIDASVTANLTVSVMLDLYNSLLVDPDQGAIVSFPTYPFAVMGGPGAAVHMQFEDNKNKDNPSGVAGKEAVGNLTVLMDADKHIVYANAGYASDLPRASSTTAGTDIPGYCSGQSYARVTATPTGAAPSPFLNIITAFDVATGKSAFHAGGDDFPGTGGMNVIDDLFSLSWASSNPKVKVNCFADDDSTNLAAWDSAFIPYLGYTYTAGPGNAATAPGTDFTVMKIVDPSNLLGHTGGSCQLSAGCGTYPQ